MENASAYANADAIVQAKGIGTTSSPLLLGVTKEQNQNAIFQRENGKMNTKNCAATAEYGSIQNNQDSIPPPPPCLSLSQPPLMTHLEISAILSTAFAYACIVSTFFLLTGPIECQRIEDETKKYYSHPIGKSIAIGGFAVLAGIAQLITPILGLLSDSYKPKKEYRQLYNLGNRIPYLIMGTFMVVIGLVGDLWSSSPIHDIAIPDSVHDESEENFIPIRIGKASHIVYSGAWIQYTIYFFVYMLGLNIVYTVMLVLIPDLVPTSQTGIANGTLALLIVSGSLFGFFSFHTLLGNNVMNMYKMYIIVSILTAICTCVAVSDRVKVLKRYNMNMNNSLMNHDDDDENRTTIYEEDTTLTKATPTSITGSKPTTTSSTTTISQQDYPSLPLLIYFLLYEPIEHKSKSEILSSYWIDITEHHDFFIVTISRFFYYMGISSQSFFLYFVHDMLKQSSSTAARTTDDAESIVALLAMVVQSSGAITCYPVGILSDQYLNGRRKPFVYTACILLSIGYILLLFCNTLTQMIWVCVLLGASNGMYLTMDTSLAVDTLDIQGNDYDNVNDSNDDDDCYGNTAAIECNVEAIDDLNHNDNPDSSDDRHHHHHHHGAAQLLGVWGVFGFIGQSLGPIIGGTLLLSLGHIPKTRSPSTSTTSSSSLSYTTTPHNSYYNEDGLSSSSNLSDVTSNTTGSISITTQFYKFQGYEVLFCLSAFCFFCSAVSLAFVKKKGV